MRQVDRISCVRGSPRSQQTGAALARREGARSPRIAWPRRRLSPTTMPNTPSLCSSRAALATDGSSAYLACGRTQPLLPLGQEFQQLLPKSLAVLVVVHIVVHIVVVLLVVLVVFIVHITVHVDTVHAAAVHMVVTITGA